MNDDAITDREDAAIARALHQPPGAGSPGRDDHDDHDASREGPDHLDDTSVDEYREVLSRMPFDEVRPPDSLESRVLAAARSARAPRTPHPVGQETPAVPGLAPAITRIDSARSARARRWLLPSVAAAAAAAAVALVMLRPDTGSRPGSTEAQVVSAPTPAELAALLAEPDARLADLTDASGATVGRAVVGDDGTGYLYDLALPATARGERLWLWLASSGEHASAGGFGDRARRIGFEIDGPVDAVLVTIEPAGADPDRPSRTVAEGELGSSG